MSRLRLDFVSPLPPARSGIADYAADLLPALAALADLRAVRLPGTPAESAGAAGVPAVAFDQLASGGRIPLYQMGNNELHEAIDGAARRLPGIVTLHDIGLHHLLLGETLGRGDFDGYVERLRLDHGWIGEAVARGFGWGFFGDAAQFALLANRSLLVAQRGVLVHGRWAAELLAEEIPGLPVRVVPMAMPLPPDDARRAPRAAQLRRAWGVPDGAPLLGSVGFQTPIKRTAVAVRALARRPLEEAHLVIAGEASAGLDFEALALEVGVASRVHVQGYVPFADFESTIAACDLMINLRYPTAGETSASLLRILALGKPALVSDFAQFRDLPESAVARVPLGEPEEEVESFATRVGELLGQPDTLRRMGEAARRLVAAENDPSRAARAVVAACEDLLAGPGGAAPSDAARSAVAPPPSSWVWSPLAADIVVSGAGPPWPAGERRRIVARLTNPGPARWLRAAAVEGGLAVALRLLDESGQDLEAGRPWRPIERDVEPGESVTIEWSVRRPPGPARLVVEPQVLGRGTLAQVGGAPWEAAI